MIAELDTRKQRIINIITGLDNRKVVEKIEQLLVTELTPEQNRILAELHQPLDEKTDLDDILKEQNYTGPNKRRFQRLVKKLDIQEPVEDLLALLAK
jgi:hypothetical protein